MHILNQVQVNLIYNRNRNLLLCIEISFVERTFTVQLPTDGDATGRTGLYVQRRFFQCESDGRPLCVQISSERPFQYIDNTPKAFDCATNLPLTVVI